MENWIRKWQPTPVFLPGKFHGPKSLAGFSLWGHKVRNDWVTGHTHDGKWCICSLNIKKQTKNRTAVWSSSPTPGHISGENSNSKTWTHPSVHSYTIYNSQIWKQPICPKTYVDKEDVVYIYSGILLSHKKKEISTPPPPNPHSPLW